jgi:hypothetical protein
MEFENRLVEFRNKQVTSDSGCVNFYGGQIQKPHFSTRNLAPNNKEFCSKTREIAFETRNFDFGHLVAQEFLPKQGM